MPTSIHAAGPTGQRSPGLDAAIAGYLAENPPAGGGGASALDDLTDVDTTGQTTGDVLKFNGTTWVADAASAGTVSSTDISDSSAVGRSVLTAADAATARTAIGAGTSSLVLGTTAGTAKAGDYAPDLSGYVPTSRTVNGKALSANVTLSAADVGASTFSGAYADLSGKPTLGTAAATASTDYATAAQGAKADSAIPSGLVDAKGDLIVATAADTVARLAAGTNGHVLTADSAQASGVKWAAPPEGGGGGGSGAPAMAVRAIVGRLLPLPGVSNYDEAAAGGTQAKLAHWIPYIAHRPLSLASIRTYCWTGQAGAYLRIGLYEMDPDTLRPTNLIADLGTLAGTSAGEKVLTISGGQDVPAEFMVGLWASDHADVRWSRITTSDSNLLLYSDAAAAGGRGLFGPMKWDADYSAAMPSTAPAPDMWHLAGWTNNNGPHAWPVPGSLL